MADVTHAPALIRLVTRLRSEDDLLRSAAEAARAHGRADKALPEAEVRRHIVALLDAVLAIVSGNGEEVAAAAAAADQLAVDRAHQGISLPVLMSGVQAARAVLLQALMTTGRELMSADDLLPVLAELDARVNDLQMGMLTAYRSAEQDLSRTARTARVEALRELINGGPVSWAGEAGLDADRHYRCMVADVSTPPGLPPCRRAHGHRGRRLGHRQRLPVPGHQPAPAGAPAERRARRHLARRPARAAAERRTSGAARPSPSTGRRARAGCARSRRRRSTSPSPAHEPLGRMLADEMLAPLDPRDEFHRLLADTARAYLAHGSKADLTAAALHVHPNTVKYRIRRLGELTGGLDAVQRAARGADALRPLVVGPVDLAGDDTGKALRAIQALDGSARAVPAGARRNGRGGAGAGGAAAGRPAGARSRRCGQVSADGSQTCS